MSAIGAFTLVAAGTGMNATAVVSKGRDPMGTIMAGTVLGVICVGLDSATDSTVGTAFAALFVLGSFLTNGVSTIELVNRFIQSYQE